MVVLVFVWFFVVTGVGRAAEPARKLMPAATSLHATMLLMFAARPYPTVPICLYRHNFATDEAPVLAGDEVKSTAPEADPARRAKGSQGWLPAKELSKSWRFFPTYVEV
jgi:hypothetical protein